MNGEKIVHKRRPWSDQKRSFNNVNRELSHLKTLSNDNPQDQQELFNRDFDFVSPQNELIELENIENDSMCEILERRNNEIDGNENDESLPENEDIELFGDGLNEEKLKI